MSTGYPLNNAFHWSDSNYNGTILTGLAVYGAQYMLLKNMSESRSAISTETQNFTKGRRLGHILCSPQASRISCAFKHALVPLLVAGTYHLSYNYWRPAMWFRIRDQSIRDADKVWSLYQSRVESNSTPTKCTESGHVNNIEKMANEKPLQSINEKEPQSITPASVQNTSSLKITLQSTNDDFNTLRIIPGTNTLIGLITRILPIAIAMEVSFQFYRRATWIPIQIPRRSKRLTIGMISFLLFLDALQDDIVDISGSSPFLSLDALYPRKDVSEDFFHLAQPSEDRLQDIRKHMRNRK